MCEYCNNREYGEDVKYLSERKMSLNTENCFVGLEMYVNARSKSLDGFCVLDSRHIKPISAHFYIPIKFCPMCGCSLED